jgi:tetratricopeptide (TPR) repeat protein
VALLRAIYSYSIGSFGLRNSPELAGLVTQIEQVVALDPESAEAHASLGLAHFQGWDLNGAERELRRAVTLNPNYATAHQWLGLVLFSFGRMDEGLAETRLSAELDPLSPAILINLSWALSLVGRNHEALALIDRALALRPDSIWAMAGRAWVLVALGHFPEASAVARQLPTNLTDCKILVLGQAGFRAEAEALLPGMDLKTYWPKSLVLLGVGHREEALKALDDPSQIRAEHCLPIFCDPLYDEIRDDPRFERFLETLGLIEANARVQAWRKAHPEEASE